MIANIHKFISLPYQAALEFIVKALESDEPSLSGLFGWHQPNDDDEKINLSEVYLSGGSFDSFELSTALNKTPHIDSDSLREIIRFIRDSGYTGKLSEWYCDSRNIEGLYESDTVCSTLGDIEFRLDSSHVLLTKLAIFSVNAIGSEAHNWAVEYLQYLAYELTQDGKLEFSPYEVDNYSSVETQVFCKLLECGYYPRFTLSDYDNSKPDYYLDPDDFYRKTNQSVLDWNSEESTDTYDEKVYLYLDECTPHITNIWDYRDGIKPLILYWISELCKAWQDGDFTLAIVQDNKYPNLSQFTYLVNTQLTFDL